jgi:hypothetical protein
MFFDVVIGTILRNVEEECRWIVKVIAQKAYFCEIVGKVLNAA